MKNRAILILSLFECVLSIPGHTQQLQCPQLAERISQKLENLSSWSFDLMGEMCTVEEGWDTTLLCSVYATHEHTDFMLDDKTIRFKKDSVWIVDHSNGNFSVGSRALDTISGISYYGLAFGYVDGLLGYSRYWFDIPRIGRNKVEMLPIKDSTDCVLFIELCQSSWLYNHKTEAFDIPIYDSLFYYLDSTSMWVNVVEVRRSVQSDVIFRFRISNIHENIMIDNDSLFDSQNPIYGEYEIYNMPSRIPSSIFAFDEMENSELTDEVLGFPLVNVEGDTLRLRDTAGWKLINFWHNSCRACLDHFYKLKQEKDKIGYRILESNGISVFCVNYLSGNVPRFRELARKFEIEDIGYSARDMKCVYVPYTPYFLLYAPDGTLVFKGQYERQEDLIRAKRRYERWHKKK